MRYLIENRDLVIKHARGVKIIVTSLQAQLEALKLNIPEAGEAKESLAELTISIDNFVGTLQESADDEAQRIYWQALLKTLQAWDATPAGNAVIKTVLATAALSLASVCGVGILGEAIVGAAVLGTKPVAKLIESLKGLIKGLTKAAKSGDDQ